LPTTIRTPDDIIQELMELRERAERGVRVLHDSEVKAVTLELEADKIEALAHIEAVGSVAHKQAIAKIKSADARLQADLAKAEFQRVKQLLRQLELAQSSLQTQARMVEMTWKTAGVGER
jgi:hypothetical protein